VSPNKRIPAIVDHDPMGGGTPVSVFESGALVRGDCRKASDQTRLSMAKTINTQPTVNDEASRKILFGQTAAAVNA
jgi:hypothetical protein